MSRAFDVVVLGGANWDFFVRGARLPKAGETLEGESFVEAPGGKGANQAVAAARLGARTALIARIGRDARGDAQLDALRAEGVDVRFISRDDHAPSGVALIHVDAAGEKQILAAPGASLTLLTEHIEAAREALASRSVLLTPLEAPLDSVRAAIAIARDAGARIVLDPAPPRELPAAFFRGIDLVRPNASEAQVLTGITVHDRDSAREAARKLRDFGAAAAVVAAPGGDLLAWNHGETWLPHVKVEAVDATGAGDAFAAAIAVRLAEDASYEDAARFASVTAALATTKLGAQTALPRRDEVLALLHTC